MFGADIRRQRVGRKRDFRQWHWHLDEMYAKLNGEMVFLWHAVDQEGEIRMSNAAQRQGTRQPRLLS